MGESVLQVPSRQNVDNKRVELDGYPFKMYSWEGFPECHPPIKYLRAHLVEVYRVCWWCKVPCVVDAPKEGERALPNMGTVDHLVASKNRNKGDKVPKVLACYECNFKRSKAQNRTGDTRVIFTE